MKKLNNVLMINGASSGVTGIGLIAFAEFIASLFGVTSTLPFTLVGLFLVVFGIVVINEGRKPSVAPAMLKLIITLDVSWVIVSIVIVALQLFGLTLIGYLLISGVAAWVGLMAYLQSVGLRAIGGA